MFKSFRGLCNYTGEASLWFFAVRCPEGGMPRNEGGDDLLKRYLDCAVIQALHEIRDEALAACQSSSLARIKQ